MALNVRRAQAGSTAATLWGRRLPAAMNDINIRLCVGAQLDGLGFPLGLRTRDIVNLYTGLHSNIDPEVGEALGLSELLGKPLAALSRGQRKRVGLFLALAHGPKLIVLDEASDGLDSIYREALIGLLNRRRSKAMILCATHDPLELNCCDKLLVMREGKQNWFGRLSDFFESAQCASEVVIEVPEVDLVQSMLGAVYSSRAACRYTIDRMSGGWRLQLVGERRLEDLRLERTERISSFSRRRLNAGEAVLFAALRGKEVTNESAGNPVLDRIAERTSQ